ncbi:MAG: urea transporter [Firmicutes bacterium]|nr:urea transporter [Bacillota bacterium]
MASFATCKFPGVDEFMDYGEKNPVAGYINSVLSGFGQIVLSDNPVTGLLIILGIYLGGAPSQLVTALWAACVASAFAYFIGVPKMLVQHGLYTFSGAVVGLGISLWGYTVQAVYPQLLIYATVGGVVSVILTAALNSFFGKWEAPSLAVPYCSTLIMIIPALYHMSNMDPVPYSVPSTAQIMDAFTGIDFLSFIKCTVAGVGEICFQIGIPSGICLLLAVLISSRIDFVVSIVCAALATGFAVALGLPDGNILIGLYGFNAALVGMGLFGRAFRMSGYSAVLTVLMALFSVILNTAMGVIFQPLGAPVAALPFALIVIGCIMCKDYFTKLQAIPIVMWGVPETIEKALREQDNE